MQMRAKDRRCRLTRHRQIALPLFQSPSMKVAGGHLHQTMRTIFNRLNSDCQLFEKCGRPIRTLRQLTIRRPFTAHSSRGMRHHGISCFSVQFLAINASRTLGRILPPHLVVMPRSIVRDFNRPRTMQPQSRPRFPCQVACPSPLPLSLAHSLVVGFRYLGCRYRIESRGNGNRVASIDTRKFCHPIKCFIFDGAVPRLVTGSHSWSRLILGWSSFRVPFFGFIRRGACLGSNNAAHQLKDADKYVPVVSALFICFPLSSPFEKKQLTASEEKRKL